METTLQIGKRGSLVLPASLREQYGLQEGDTLHFLDLDGFFVLAPQKPQVPELAREIEQMRRQAGLSVEEMLDDLKRQRGRTYQERDGDADSA